MAVSSSCFSDTLVVCASSRHSSWQPVVKLQLHSAGDASPLRPTALKNARWGPRPLTALLLPHIFPILHPTVHKTHGGGPALRSSRRSTGVPTARTVRRGVERRGASPPSVRRRTFTTGCYDVRFHTGQSLRQLPERQRVPGPAQVTKGGELSAD